MAETLKSFEDLKDSLPEEIPKGWNAYRLSEVVPRAEYGISVSLDDEIGVPVLRMNNLKDGEIDLADLKTSASPKAASLLLQPFDVLFNRTNSIEHVGRTAIWRGQLDQVSFASYLVRLVPDTSRLIPEFLNRWLNLPSIQLLIRRYATPGVHQVNINPTNLRKIWIALPESIEEQQQIVEVLNAIDSTIAHTSTLIAKLKQMKAGLLHDLLTRGLDENGKLRDAIEHPEQFKGSPLGQIPNDWESWTLREVLTGIDAGKSFSCPDIPAAGGEWGVLKVSAVHPNGFKPQENKVVINSAFINPAFEVKHRDLLITRSNTYDLVGLTCLVQNPPSQLLLSDKTLRLNVNAQLASVEFLAHVMQMPHIRLQIQTNATGSSASMKNISQEEIRSFRVALPKSVEEQNRIVDVLNSYSDRIHTEETYLNKLKKQKEGLIHDLLTGMIRTM